MADTRQPVRLIGQGDSFPEALASMLDQLSRLPGPMAPPADDDRSVRLRAEAASLPVLVADLIEALVGAAQDYDAAPTSVILDGFRAIEGGYRAWVTATLCLGARQESTVRVIDEPAVSQANPGWLISVTVVAE
jgi:hypothetical protein